MIASKPNDQILDFLRRYESYAIIGHEEPDGDCLGSQFALAGYLRRNGKTAECFSPGPLIRPEVVDFAEHISDGPLDGHQAAVVVDCSTPDRIGHFTSSIDGIPTAVIDHHASGEPFGDVRYLVPDAPSVTYLIQLIIEASGGTPDPVEAGWLFFGLCTDTGFFRHLDSGSDPVFMAASRLVAAGASPRKTYGKIFGNRSFGSRRLLGILLARAQEKFNGRLLITWESSEELKEFGKLQRDSDSLYQQLQGVSGCDAVALVRQEDEESCSVGLRSFGGVDVGAIAGHFGGGGHSRAAGFTRHGHVDDVVRETAAFFETVLL